VGNDTVWRELLISLDFYKGPHVLWETKWKYWCAENKNNFITSITCCLVTSICSILYIALGVVIVYGYVNVLAQEFLGFPLVFADKPREQNSREVVK
jgi:hypothetical protein